METTQTSTIASIDSRSAWRKTDTMWMLGLYGTAIGAGVLFLPINAGVGGMIPLIIMAILAFPMTFFAHRGLTRFVLSGKNPGEDITEVVEEHFGIGAGKLITLLYFFAIYPILLVYSVAITNTVESFLTHQLAINPPPRAILSLILIVGMMTIVRFGEQMIVKAMSILVFPFVAALMLLALYLIPQWNGAALETLSFDSAASTGNGLWMTLWLAIPVMVFSFNHSPIISSFAVAKREEYGEGAEKKCSKILAFAHIMMVLTVMFFVFSCVLSLTPADLAAAKEQNISILSYLANHFNAPIIAWMAPIIAMIAITKSFLGHYLGAREGFNGMVIKSLRGKGKSIEINKLNKITALFMLVTTWIVATLNPSILGMIETLGGPIIAMILFLMPMYAIQKVPAMRKYSGHISNVFVVIMGLIARHILTDVTRVVVDVYGSLSLTGKGHHTDIAIIMGLAGNLPDTVDIDAIPSFIQDVNTHGRLLLANGQHEVEFPVDKCMNFHADNLSLHENGMRITALAGDKVLYSQTYYSIGGGFIVDEEHFGLTNSEPVNVPYPYKTAADLQRHCQETGLSLSGLMMQNELALHSKEALEQHFARVWEVMRSGIERGITTEGVLPGKLRVPRRAAALRRVLVSQDKTTTDPMAVVDWINMFALAVNEENAAGGRVVTAPTNGACGIVPAVLAYYDKFIREVNANSLARYMLVASAIGSLYKMNASISGAEVGCQGEVGVACSMAAAGLAELLGGSPAQVCIAAEIAMEHNLGLTCDPVAGQVQVPCIERNAIASVKAVNAARMALRRTSEPRVCLDKVIETMYETGKDMNAKYRETSRGGLAMKIVTCD